MAINYGTPKFSLPFTTNLPPWPIEVRLRDDAGTAPAASLRPSASKDFPSPLSTPTAHGDDDDNDNVVERLEELESRTNQLRERTDDTIARLTTMQNLPPPQNVVAEQLSPSLHAGLKVRFDAITRDRDVLNSNTEHYAAKQEKVNIRQSLAIDTLRTENAELRAKLGAVEAALARLSLAPPAPIRLRSRSPEYHTFGSRPRSPIPRAARDARVRSRSAETRDLKRQRYNDPDQTLLITMGPFLPTSVLPTELFEMHLHTAIPDHFRGAKPYHVEHDPVKALMSAWAVNNVPGYHTIKMYTVEGSNESASYARPRYQGQRGGRQGQSTSYNGSSSRY
ncbi:hypothetical protein C8J57DRAFT_1476238 [Mycena rebaudengoi]|nr:hypothetical protein C8J57DRAFT_1476238 [Mycena rebaudengoi]